MHRQGQNNERDDVDHAEQNEMEYRVPISSKLAKHPKQPVLSV